MLGLVFLFLLVTSVNACCSPLQWEMQMGMVSINGTGLSLTRTNSTFHYDSINFHVARIHSATSQPTFINRTIWDYPKRLMYEIDEVFGTCDVTTLDTPFHSICTPEDGKLSDHFFYGGGDMTKLPASSYEYDRKGYSGFVKFTEGPFPSDPCVPIISVDYGPSLMTFMTFEDFVNGISDPSVFTPPPQCKHANKKTVDPRIKMHPFLGVPLIL